MTKPEDAQPPAVGSPFERPVGRPVPERDDFERWAEANGYGTHKVPGGKCPEGLPVYADTRTHAAWWAWQAANDRWHDALRQAWQMVDPLKPAGTPGSYARGQDTGIVAALTTLRENLKTPNDGAKRAPATK
jgi:hypothetical protein